jgi:hypothetical protein
VHVCSPVPFIKRSHPARPRVHHTLCSASSWAQPLIRTRHATAKTSLHTARSSAAATGRLTTAAAWCTTLPNSRGNRLCCHRGDWKAFISVTVYLATCPHMYCK